MNRYSQPPYHLLQLHKSLIFNTFGNIGNNLWLANRERKKVQACSMGSWSITDNNGSLHHTFIILGFSLEGPAIYSNKNRLYSRNGLASISEIGLHFFLTHKASISLLYQGLQNLWSISMEFYIISVPTIQQRSYKIGILVLGSTGCINVEITRSFTW